MTMSILHYDPMVKLEAEKCTGLKRFSQQRDQSERVLSPWGASFQELSDKRGRGTVSRSKRTYLFKTTTFPVKMKTGH